MINKDRIAVLIGKNGKTKEVIELLTNTEIEIDSKTGEYNIKPKEHNTSEKINLDVDIEEIFEEKISLDSVTVNDPSFSVWITKNIIEAINIGFKPEKALKLLNQEFSMEVINLEKVIGSSEKKLTRIKGRLIGEKGVMRESIEKYSDVYMSVYKNLIGLIGKFDNLKVAKSAINMILEGMPHNSALNYLQKKYRERKDEEFKQIWKPSFD